MSVNKRRRFKEWEVVATLMEQGIVIPCFRCKEPLPLPTTPKQIQREHIHELALDGPDIPANCRFSHTDCHAVITNGTKATTAGSSKHRIAKAKRLGSRQGLTSDEGDFQRDSDRVPEFRRSPRIASAGVTNRPTPPKSRWPQGRKIQSRGFQKAARP